MKPDMNSGEYHLQRLRRVKGIVLVVTAVMVAILIVFNYIFLGMPLIKGLVNFVVALFIIVVVLQLSFSYVASLQRRLNEVVAERLGAEARLRLQSAALASAANAIVITDGDGRITWINPAFTQLTGYLPDEVIGQNPSILKSGHHDNAFYWRMWQTILDGRVWRGELINRRKDGSLYTEEQTITPVMDDQGQISQFIAIKQDITRRKAMQAAEREQRILAEALREAGVALSATLDLDEVIDILLDQIGRVVPYDMVSLMRVQNGRAVIARIRGSEPFPKELPHLENTVFTIETTPNLLELIDSQQTVIISDTEKYPGWIKSEAFSYVRSWMGAPIFVQGDIFGFLSLDKREPGFYLPKHAHILSAFALQASLILHNAQLYAEKEEALRRERQVSRVIQATSATLDLPHVLQRVVELAAPLVDAEGAALALLSPDGDSISYPYLFHLPQALNQPAAKGQGLAWRVIETGQTINISAYDEHENALENWAAIGIRSILSVPIMVGAACLGALGLMRFSSENTFNAREQALAEMVGRQVGIAIQNARLFDETRRRARELDLLNRVVAGTAVAKNEAQVLQVGCTELARFFTVSQAVCVMLDKTRTSVRIVAESLDDDLPSFINTAVPVTGNPILQKFFDTAVPITLPDVRHILLPPEMASALTERSMVSVLMVPIFVREQIVGAIGIHSRELMTFTDNDIELAVTVGEEVGQALAMARLNEQIRTYAAELEKRVAERTGELAAANEQLQELDRLKSKFVSDVSHELRTPITNLGMYLDLLERGRTDRRTHYVNVLQKELARIRQLVEDILDLSRLEASRKQGITFEPVDLNRIVEQVVTAQMPQAQAAGLQLIFDPEPDLTLIHGAQNQLSQVATNLITNAINYTPEGRIEVTTYQKNSEVCLKITDTGMGIDATDMPHLFERFYRGQRVAQLGVPGTGLGLGIVKEIVDLHGGRVEATSEVGRGSEFRVWLAIGKNAA